MIRHRKSVLYESHPKESIGGCEVKARMDIYVTQSLGNELFYALLAQ